MKTATYEQDQIMQIWKRWYAKGQKKPLSYQQEYEKQLKDTADQRTGKLEHRRLWLCTYFLIHINTCLFKRLFFVYVYIEMFWNQQYKQFLSNPLHFYGEFSRKSLTMINLIYFLSTQ